MRSLCLSAGGKDSPNPWAPGGPGRAGSSGRPLCSSAPGGQGAGTVPGGGPGAGPGGAAPPGREPRCGRGGVPGGTGRRRRWEEVAPARTHYRDQRSIRAMEQDADCSFDPMLHCPTTAIIAPLVRRAPAKVNYPESIDYLLSFADFEGSGRFHDRPDVEPVLALLRRLGGPHLGRDTVHIAGSKGKGSVAAGVESSLGPRR